jgi:3-phenylpropionate/trans-cinnamate dioxygenase ferredoxin reductase subunit
MPAAEFHQQRVLIVGASAAGLAAATALRRRGHTGPLTILGAEPETPYDRPPLSKQLLAGDWPAERLDLLPRQKLAELKAELRLGTRAVALDLSGRRVLDGSGASHEFDAAVIATGVSPRMLACARPGQAGVYVLRTLRDALGLSAALTAGCRLVVAGGGFLGLEVAATAQSRGAEVTVVEAVEQPLAARLGPTASRRLLGLHRERGVAVRTGTGIAEICGDPVRAVLLTDGTSVPADAVLIAIGARPNTDWLAGSGLDVADGITCDEYCRAAPAVWAAGDLARWFHHGIGAYLRLEHRTNATEQGQAAAADIMGEGRPFVPVPFFWTDHYDTRLQVAGIVPAGDSAERAAPEPGVITFHAQETLSGALGWNAVRQLMPYRQALRARYELAAAQ